MWCQAVKFDFILYVFTYYHFVLTYIYKIGYYFTSPECSREFRVVFSHYLMHSEVFLIIFPSQILLVSEIFNVFCETFSSKSKVYFDLNKVLLFVNVC